MEVPKRFIDRDFLLGSKPTWTDMMRNKENRTAIADLQEQLHHAKSDEEKNQIREAIDLLNNEIDQWAII